MPTTYYEIASLEPLVFGDGRPFGNEPGSTRVRGTTLPNPSTLAGALRTAYARANGMAFNDDSIAKLLAMDVRGPVLAADGTPVFARPASSQTLKKSGVEGPVVVPMLPSGGIGCNLPEGIRPLALPPQVADGLDAGKDAPYELSKESGYAYLKLEDMAAWLTASAPEDGWQPAKVEVPAMERRVHVGIEHSTKTSKQGMLFETEGACLDVKLLEGGKHKTEYRVLASLGGEIGNGVMTLGGERRMALCRQAGPEAFACPPAVAQALRKEPTRVCLVLATPAVFIGGWRPGWADGGAVPGVEGLKLRLVSAACDRRGWVSGWDLYANAPKPVRWLAPAGSVYFFEVIEGDPGVLADAWLRPVSDQDQDRRDGFGLALWGIWKESEAK